MGQYMYDIACFTSIRQEAVKVDIPSDATQNSKCDIQKGTSTFILFFADGGYVWTLSLHFNKVGDEYSLKDMSVVMITSNDS